MENNANIFNKLNDGLTEAMSNWWNGLSKEEILQFVGSIEAITADSLRDLFGSLGSQFAFNGKFVVSGDNGNDVTTDFNKPVF